MVVLEAGRKIYDGEPASGTLVLRNRMSGGTASGDAEDDVQLKAVRFAAEPGAEAQVQFDPGQPLAISVDIELCEARGPLTDRIYLHASVLGPHDVPVWQMETLGGLEVPEPELDAEGRPIRRLTVDFIVPLAPTLLGAFAFKVSVSDAYTGRPLAVRRFTDLFGIAGPQAGGLIPVDYDVRRRG